MRNNRRKHHYGCAGNTHSQIKHIAKAQNKMRHPRFIAIKYLRKYAEMARRTRMCRKVYILENGAPYNSLSDLSCGKSAIGESVFQNPWIFSVGIVWVASQRKCNSSHTIYENTYCQSYQHGVGVKWGVAKPWAFWPQGVFKNSWRAATTGILCASCNTKK